MAGPVEKTPSLLAAVGLLVEVLLVGEPAEHGTDERTDQLRGDGDEELRR
jgi:hypothetical protein